MTLSREYVEEIRQAARKASVGAVYTPHRKLATEYVPALLKEREELLEEMRRLAGR